MKRYSLMRIVVAVLVSLYIIFPLTLLADSSSGKDTQSHMQIGFFFWHRKGSFINTSEYDPKFPERYEYLELDEWSPNGWAPQKIDVVLQVGTIGKDKLKQVSSLRMAMSLRVGPLKIDPNTKLTDIKVLEANAVWLPAQLIKTMSMVPLPKTGKLILLNDIDLEAIYTDLWKQDMWPIELKVEVLLEPLKPKRLQETVIFRSLRLIPGD